MRQLLICLLCVAAPVWAMSQAQDYRVVFDMTSKDSVNQQNLVRQLTLIKDGNPNAKLEVVVYSHGMDLVLKDKSPQASAVSQLLARQDITFKVCAATMKRSNVEPSQLIPGVQVVPDGIYEIITRQREGWGYIKVGR